MTDALCALLWLSLRTPGARIGQLLTL